MTASSGDGAPAPAAPSAPSPEARAAWIRGLRYGISLVAVIGGVYLVLGWSPYALLQQGYFDPLDMLRAVLELGIAVLAIAGGLAIAPASPVRTIPAALLALVVTSLAAVGWTLMVSGALPVRAGLLGQVLDPAGVALAMALLGWLVVRGRHPLTYLLAVLAVVPGAVRVFLLTVFMTATPLMWFTDIALTVLVGIGGAWAAAGVDRLRGRGQGGDLALGAQAR